MPIKSYKKVRPKGEISKFHQVQANDRRQFLEKMMKTSALAGVFSATGYLAYSNNPVRDRLDKAAQLKDFHIEASAQYSELVIVEGREVDSMVRAAVEKLGGISHFVKAGEKVLIKPNVGWDRQPEQAANTNPEVVSAVVNLCREAGAKDIIVTDVSLNDPKRCFSRSGIKAAAENSGARILLPSNQDFILTDLKGELLQNWPVAKYYHQVDKIINLPVVKHHSLCGCTLAMKNWYGAIGGRRNQLHQNIHTSIVDLASAFRTSLTIMDATRILRHNGPTGGSLDDVVIENTIIAGTDEVAIDSYSLNFLDLQATDITYLVQAEKKGIGVTDWRSLRYKQITV